MIRKSGRRMPIIALVQHPWGYRGSPGETPYRDCLAGLLVDVKGWADEHLVDEVIAAGYYRPGGTPEMAYRWLQKETGGKVPIGAYGWLISAARVKDALQFARQVAAPELLLWESDYLELPPAHADVIMTMTAPSG